MTRASIRKGAKIGRIERKLDNPTAALKQIGALMVAESQQAFRDQAFDGKRWRPRGKINVMGIIADFAAGKNPPPRRFERRPALRDTGRLAASITFKVVGDAVDVGSNLPYAAAHQRGDEVESKPITEQVQTLLWEWLKERDRETRRSLGFLLNRKYLGKTISTTVPKRQFVGITKQTIEDVREVVGVEIMEAR